MRRKDLATIVSTLHTEIEMYRFVTTHFCNSICPKSLTKELAANIRIKDERILFIRLVAEHNTQIKSHRQYRKSILSGNSKTSAEGAASNITQVINVLTNKIITNKRKATKSIKVIRKDLKGRRGSRIVERFSCYNCGITVDEGWRYKTDTDTYKFCHQCKEKVKPSTFIKTRTSIIYTPMGNDRRRK